MPLHIPVVRRHIEGCCLYACYQGIPCHIGPILPELRHAKDAEITGRLPHFVPITKSGLLHRVVFVNKANVPWSLPVPPHKFFISRRPFILRIARQHALQTHANTFNILYRRPACRAKKIETYNSIGVDVRMYWYLARRIFEVHECDFWCFFGGKF